MGKKYTGPREQIIQQEIRGILNAAGTSFRTWRNNVGSLRRCNCPECRGDHVPVRFGLAEGSADLVGIHNVTITPEMVGHRVGIFLAVEVKTPVGRLSKEQKAWLKTVSDFGGRVEVLRSPDEAVRIVELGGDYAFRG